MKTRRALQIIVGILSLTVLVCLLAAVACWALNIFFPEVFGFAAPILEPVVKGFGVIAAFLGFADLWYIVPAVACLLPAILLLIATILLFSRNKGKTGKYNAGCVLALIGIVLLTAFTFVFASDLATGAEQHLWFPSPIEWTATEMIVRYAALGLLIIFVIFIGSALSAKKKTAEKAKEKSVASTKKQSVGQTDPGTAEKINKAKRLYEMGAITQEEYRKIESSYLKK